MEAPRRFLVHLDDVSLQIDLRLHFQRTGFTARPAAEGAVEVEAPARSVVERHVQLWLLMNPAASAFVTEAP